MAAPTTSTKRMLIDKANTRIVIYVSVAAFIFIFSLVAAKTLISQAAYQNRVIDAEQKTVNQLKSDITATAQLKSSYDAFTSTPQNAIGGNPNGDGPQDGNNAKIVLDALPSSYDFPGLTTSLQTLLQGQNVQVQSIAGTDNESSLGSDQTSSSPTPTAIPFSFSVEGNYAGIQGVVSALERSIRPIQVQTLSLTGTDNGSGTGLTLSVTAQTYYQPAKTLTIRKETVK